MTSDDVRVRRFEDGDGERVREVNELAMAQTPEYAPAAPDADLRDVPGNYLDDEGSEFLVGALEDDVVATAAYVPLDDWKTDVVAAGDATAELTRMRVAPSAQGRGVGTAIYQALEERARAEEYRQFVLDTGVENDRARGFYESLGFECVEERTVTFAEGEFAFDLAVYRGSID